MDVNNHIVGSDADILFGTRANQLGDFATLESTLRFIALKHHQGDLGTFKPISWKVHPSNCYNRIDEWIEYAEDTDVELLILTVRDGTQLPISNEEGWISLEAPPYPVAPFLSKASETRVYINVTLKKAIISVRTITEKWINLLCASLFRILPWYFNGEPTEGDEKNLFKAINAKDSETYNAIINKLYKEYDFRGFALKNTLKKWMGGYRKKKIETLTDQLEWNTEKIKEYDQLIIATLSRLNDIRCTLHAFECQKDIEDDSIYRFFAAHKQIEINSVKEISKGSILQYCVTETIEYFDEDEFYRIYNNPTSAIGLAPKNVKEILFGLFGANKGTIRTEAVFELENLSSCQAVATRTRKHDRTHLAHPHLIYFGCLGGNVTYINKYMSEGNWDMAIEQTIAATKNIFFGDHAATVKLVDDIGNALETNSCKFIIADNGNEMTAREFLEYLRENKVNEATQNG